MTHRRATARTAGPVRSPDGPCVVFRMLGPMLDTIELDEAVDRLADRLRRLPESRLRAGAAAEGLRLARELAARAQRLADPAGPPRAFPDAGAFAVGDQLAVAGHDLADALRAHGTPADLADATAVLRTAARRI